MTDDEPIIVAGDAHLGADNADVDAFNGFLDDLLTGDLAASKLVLLGDIWDMVRRDPFGCALETSDTISRLTGLAESMPVHYVLGNHDSYLRNLDAGRYPIDFRDQLVLESGDERIRFRHGNSFDRLQSDALSSYLSGAGDRGDIDPTKGLKDPFVSRAREAIQQQKWLVRTAFAAVRGREPAAPTSFPRRERRAHSYLVTIPEDKLVYGHTHTPYVHPDNVAANPGSWKSTAPLHNTYLGIQDGEIRLYQHSESGAVELSAAV